MMVAKKIERPLIIVLDPERVADVQGPVKWSFTRYDITEFNLFVTRDIKRAMESFFTDVSVVRKGDPVPDHGVIVADVRVDRFDGMIAGQVAMVEVRWAFALRPVEADTYLFSYAGKSRSEPRRSVNTMVASAMERAITDMLSAWTDKEVTATLRALPDPPANDITDDATQL